MASNNDSNIQQYFAVPAAHMPSIHEPGMEPTYTSLRKFCEVLERNAMSVPSSQTELGHLALVIPTTEFTAANSGIPFIDPRSPGATPDNPATVTSAASSTPARTSRRTNAATATTSVSTITSVTPSQQNAVDMLPFTAPNAIREFQEKKQEHERFTSTKTALRNLIINATDDQYIAPLKQKRTRYMLRTPLEILNHLWDTYGEIQDEDKTTNEARMKALWSPPTPIETLFQQLKEGQEFASEGNEKITDEQIVRWGYDIIKANGMFASDCRRWKLRDPTMKTWKDFQSYWKKANSVLDTIKEETAAKTYTANQVQDFLRTEMAAFVDQVNDQENQDPNVPTCLPVTESANAATALTAADVAAIVKEALGQRRSYNNNRSDNRGTKKKHKAQALLDGVPVTYCWSHGVTRNLSHTSCTCKRHKDGHKEESTYANRMGGSNEVLAEGR